MAQSLRTVIKERLWLETSGSTTKSGVYKIKQEIEMEKIQMIRDAAVENNVNTLRELLRQDPLVLEKATLSCEDNKSPLHIAAIFGHVEFVKEVLKVSPEMCLAGDRFGRIPLHFAVVRGRLPVVRELVRARPLAVRERIAGAGGNVLHLCVKNNQVEVLKFLVKTIRDGEFANRRDDDGMTILHLAVLDNKIETIKFLLDEDVVAVNAKNANGNTALDLVETNSNPEIVQFLQNAGAKRSQELDHNTDSDSDSSTGNRSEWLCRKRDAIMVVASLIATMAFQAGVNPPGGVWQDDDSKAEDPHVAGIAVMAHKHPKFYRNFIRANTVAFVSSLSTILLLISGLPLKNRFFMWTLMVIMWLTITATALTYGISIVSVTPNAYSEQLSDVIEIAVSVWCGVMSLLLLGNTIRLINRWLKKRCGVDLLREMGVHMGNLGVHVKSGEKRGTFLMC